MKKWYKSKTIIFNMLIAIITAIEINYEFIKEHNPDYYMYVVIIISIVNFYLRTITEKPIRRKKRS